MALCRANKNDWQVAAIKGFIDDNPDAFERWLETYGYENAEDTAKEVVEYLND